MTKMKIAKQLARSENGGSVSSAINQEATLMKWWQHQRRPSALRNGAESGVAA
jgi:hypothetical protein